MKQMLIFYTLLQIQMKQISFYYITTSTIYFIDFVDNIYSAIDSLVN